MVEMFDSSSTMLLYYSIALTRDMSDLSSGICYIFDCLLSSWPILSCKFNPFFRNIGCLLNLRKFTPKVFIWIQIFGKPTDFIWQHFFTALTFILPLILRLYKDLKVSFRFKYLFKMTRTLIIYLVFSIHANIYSSNSSSKTFSLVLEYRILVNRISINYVECI